MNILQITFSPTGGTDKVAEIISETLGTSINKIDKTSATTKMTPAIMQSILC